MRKLTSAFLVCALASIVAAQPATAPSSPAELTEKPEVLLKPFDYKALTIYGVKIGDPESAIPKAKLKGFGPSSELHEYAVMTGGYRIGIIDGKVKWLAVTSQKVLKSMGLDGKDDVEHVFGKADRVETREDPQVGTLYSFHYIDRRIVVNARRDRVGGIDIR